MAVHRITGTAAAGETITPTQVSLSVTSNGPDPAPGADRDVIRAGGDFLLPAY